MIAIKKELLIGSVHSFSSRAEAWAGLQNAFIKKNTRNFKYVVFLSGEVDKSFFDCEIIGSNLQCAVNSSVGLEQSLNHFHGVRAILDYFKTHPEYENYLLLDSDCFPISIHWQNVLLEKMKRHNFEIAAPFRFENLDIFPHPCALFVRRCAIQQDWLRLNVAAGKNLLNEPINDVGCGIPISKCFPLIKTNSVSLHPNFATIYNHLFYHHTCGSRSLLTRSIYSGYYDHILKTHEDHWNIEHRLFERLISNPQEFVEGLMK